MYAYIKTRIQACKNIYIFVIPHLCASNITNEKASQFFIGGEALMINETDLKDVSRESINSVHWDNIQHKPEEYNPTYHTHAEYAKRYHQHSVNDIEGIADFEKIGHLHDERYYRKEEVNDIVNSTVAPHDTNWEDIIGKPEKFSAMEHTHNEHYYPKHEIDAQLRRYASKGHIHTTYDILGYSDKEPFVLTKFVIRPEDFREEEGLVTLTVPHMQNSVNLIVKVMGTDTIERLVAVEYIDADNIKIWSDTKEDVTVTIISFDSDNESTHPAITNVAIVGGVACGVI